MLDHLVSGAVFVTLYGVSYGLVLFTISIGLVLTLGLMRVVNLAHLAFAAAGGYAAVTLTMSVGMPFLASILIAVAGVALCSLVLEQLFYVHLYGAEELNQVLMTIGLLFLAVATLNALFGPNVLPSTLPRQLSGSLVIAGVRIQAYRLAVTILGLGLLAILWVMFDWTSYGARLRAAVDNASMAQAIGIDVAHLFSVTFALGSALAALGGAVGYVILPLEPMYPFKYLTLVLIVVVLSGFGNIKASAAVAILVGVMDTFFRFLFPAAAGSVVYILLIAIILWRDRNQAAGFRR